MTRLHCADCIYYRGEFSSSSAPKICHYCLDTGNPRGCPVEGCIRKVKGTPDARTNPFDPRLPR